MYKFKGVDGEFVTGVPARDLTDDEVSGLQGDQQALFEAHMKAEQPLYEHVEDSKVEAPKAVKKA